MPTSMSVDMLSHSNNHHLYDVQPDCYDPIVPSSDSKAVRNDITRVTSLPNVSQISHYYDGDEEDDEDEDNASREEDDGESARHRNGKSHLSQRQSETRFSSTHDLSLPSLASSSSLQSTPLYTSFTSASHQLLTSRSMEDMDDPDLPAASALMNKRINSSPLLLTPARTPDYSDQADTSDDEEEEDEDDDDDDDDTSFSVRQKARPATAFLVSLPPFAAAAASVARKRRWEARQRLSIDE